jgi:hypothetical protein
MPESISYTVKTRTLTVGDGVISPVSPEVWEYRIGGVQVIRKWFSFRKRRPDVEWQTPLNDVLPAAWPARWTVELLDLINVLSLLVAMEPEQGKLLKAVMAGPLITADDLTAQGVLPVPPSASKEPKVPRTARPASSAQGVQETLDFLK